MPKTTAAIESRYTNKAFGVIHRQKQLLMLINARLEGATLSVDSELIEKKFDALMKAERTGSPNSYQLARYQEENALLRLTVLELASQLVARRALPTSSAFDEASYLDENGDVAVAVQKGWLKSAFVHWLLYGLNEKREGAKLRSDAPSLDAAAAKFLGAYNRSFRGWRTKLTWTALRRLLGKVFK